jgi:hypothetical protein
MPDAPPGDVDDDAPGAGGGNTGGRTPVVVSPVSSVTDAGLLEPVQPGPSEASDAGTPSPPVASDAGSARPTPPEAPLPPEEPPPVEPECGGAQVGGACWYLGELDQTCNGACASHGGVDPGAAAFIGTPEQGGSLEACAAILEALGEPPALVMDGFRDDGLGFGCHLFVDAAGGTSAWWLSAPAFAPTVSDPSARLVCGCTS